MPEPALRGVRVAIVNNFPGPGMGGGEVLVISIIRALRDAGATVAVVVPPGAMLGEALVAHGVEVVHTPMSLSATRGACGAIRRAAGGSGCVLVGTGYFTNLLVRLARRAGADRVVNLVGVMPDAAGGSIGEIVVRRLADRATVRRVDAFAASAEVISEQLCRRGAAPGRIHVIPNAIDPDAVRAQAAAAVPDGYPSRPPVIACAARLEHVKGVEYLIRAMRDVPEATLVLVGTGSLGRKLRELAGALGVAGRVVFLGWIEQAGPVLRAAEVVALPSLSEGLPIVVLEAMALGRPVVATAVGGTPEVVEHGVTGLLVRPADPAALAAALRELLGDPERAASMGAAGRRRVEEHFSTRQMGPAYVRLVASLTGRASLA